MFNTVEEWVACLRSDSLPVLPRTLTTLTELAADDDVSGDDLGNAILDDPLMTLKVLRYVNVTKHKHFNSDITSIGPALMMLGTGNFFSKFARLHTVDQHLADFPEVREALYLLIAKARHSAFQARDWANYRKDSRVSEVRVAALLHDLGEMLVTCYAPELTDNLLQEAGPVWRRGIPSG